MTDMLCKMYLNELIWNQSLVFPIHNFINKFIENDAYQEYLLKVTEVGLNIIRDSFEQSESIPRRFQEDYQTEQEQAIIQAQRRALIIELIKFIIEQQVLNLNNQIKNYLVITQQELLQTGIQYKGLYALLKLFGDPHSVIQTFINNQLLKQPHFDYDLF